MTRPALPRAALCLLVAAAATVGTVALGPSTSAAAPAPLTRSPLRVSVQTLAPAVVPKSGRVTITGEITNRSQQTWTDLKAYMFTSVAPLSTSAELAGAAASDEGAAVGNRLTSPGLYDDVGNLAPGQSTSYRVSVPRRSLGIGGQPGVYWIGVHVLGAEAGQIRDTVADGRARTFIPLVPTHAAPTRLALVVPVRDEVRRGAAGRLLGIASWQRSVSSDGRLDRLLNLSGRASAPITWVVDPAVLDAVRSVAEENPQIDPGATPGNTTAGSGASGSPSPSDSPSSSASPSDGASGDGSGDTGSGAQLSAEAVAARAWLDEFRRQAATHTVTTVPYGDLDVASVLASRLPALYRLAVGQSAETMTALGVSNSIPVVDPISGVLPSAAQRRIDAQTPVVLTRSAYPDAGRPVLADAGHAPVVLTDEAAGAGGPRPNSRYAALAVRQRLLSEAALHEMSSARGQPLVVSTPPHWNPGNAWNDSDFFVGLHQPWLRMVDLPAVVSAATPGGPGAGGPTVYPRADRTAQLPLGNLLASDRLVKTGATYGRLLPANDTVEGVLSRVGLLGSSQNIRDDADRALAQTDSTTTYIRGQMQAVRIEGPQFVMMSGEQGPIQVTLVNGLDQPVRVGITARTANPDLKISRPDPVTLGPGKRTAVRLEASSTDIGVHAVTLEATDSAGDPLGSLTKFSVRTSRVSTVIWVIMAAGGALLFLAIAVRLFRRVRRRKSTHGPRLPREPAGLPGPEPGA